jgi:hypothetical protein
MRATLLLLWAALLPACDCPAGQVSRRLPDGTKQCVPADDLPRDFGPSLEDAGAGDRQVCWENRPQADDPITLAHGSPDMTPPMAQCAQDLVYMHEPACLVDPCFTSGRCDALPDVDDDCDGCIDEDQDAGGDGCCENCGGRRVAPADLVPKPSAFAFGRDDEWTATAEGLGCTPEQATCDTTVASLRYFCDGAHQMEFQGQVRLLARDDRSCLFTAEGPVVEDGRAVCGLGAAIAWFQARVVACNDGLRSARLVSHADDSGRIGLELQRLESNDPHVGPLMSVEDYARELSGLFRCVTDVAARANSFGDRRDTRWPDGIPDACQSDADGDGLLDEDDDCPHDANPTQADADGDGRGDACEVPLPPAADLPDAPPSPAYLVTADVLPTDGDDPASALRSVDALSAAAASFDAANDGMGAMAAGARSIPRWARDIAEALHIVEDASGKVFTIVLGFAYEKWAKDTFCRSPAHEAANLQCETEWRTPINDLDWEHPVDLTYHHPTLGEVTRFARHDCHCPGLVGRLAPLSEEYKAPVPYIEHYSNSPRDGKPGYRDRLITQCKRYLHTLAGEYAETFPDLGGRADAYRKMLATRSRGRPAVLYRLAHASPAMREVLAACNFSAELGLPDDHGLMSEAEVIARSTADPEQPVSAFQWRVSHPGWHQQPDVPVCEDGGQAYFFATSGHPENYPEGTPVDQWREEDMPGLKTVCYWSDREHDPSIVDSRGLWGAPSLPMFSPGLAILRAELTNDTAADLQRRIIAIDGVGTILDPEGPGDFLSLWLQLSAFGYPVRIGLDREGSRLTFADPGYSLLMNLEQLYTFADGVDILGPDGAPAAYYGWEELWDWGMD